MYLIGVVVLCALSTVHAGWVQELSLGRGLQLGSGISLHLDRLKRENASLLERHALRVDYSGVGLSVGKALNKDAIQVGLYVGDKFEGRKQKVGEVLLPALIGFKATGVAVLMFSMVTLFVLKALGVAKLALMVAAATFFIKFLHSGQHQTPHVEVEDIQSRHPMFYEYPSATGSSGSANYLSYVNYAPTGAEQAQTAAQYTIVEAPTGNSSVAAPSVSKRRDFLRRKSQAVPLLTVRKYTIQH